MMIRRASMDRKQDTRTRTDRKEESAYRRVAAESVAGWLARNRRTRVDGDNRCDRKRLR